MDFWHWDPVDVDAEVLFLLLGLLALVEDLDEGVYACYQHYHNQS